MPESQTKIIYSKDEDFEKKLNIILKVDQKNQLNLYNTVFEIIKKIQESGDDALIDFVHKFDSAKINKIDELYISKDVLKDAYNSLRKEEKQALNIAAERIKKFHKRQIPIDIKYKDDIDVNLGLKYSPIVSAGFYVPGGKAIYPSSVLMNAIPALVAGVERRVVISPISDLHKSCIAVSYTHLTLPTRLSV